jgi:S-DNA-T family DNA segregation ATPase FtsK/SpoIIIE
MLFLPPEASGPLRVQGVWVADQEIERVVAFWQRTHGEEGHEAPPWETMMEKEAMLAERDGLLEEAIKLVQQTQRCSASMLQRRLRVGYPRAARLIEQLEEVGVVAPPTGAGKEREVLLGPDDEFRLEPPDVA